MGSSSKIAPEWGREGVRDGRGGSLSNKGVIILLSGLSGTIVEWGYVPLGLVVSRPPTYVWVWRMYPRTGGVITRLRFSGLGMIEEVRNAKVEKPP